MIAGGRRRRPGRPPRRGAAPAAACRRAGRAELRIGRPHPRVVSIAACQPRESLAGATVVPVAQRQRDLEPDLRIGVVGQPEQGIGHDARTTAQTGPTAAITLSRTRGSGSFETGQRRWLVEAAADRPASRSPGRASWAAVVAIASARSGAIAAGSRAVQQQPLGRVALPAAGAVERGDESRPYRACRAAGSAGASCRPDRRDRSALARCRRGGRAASPSRRESIRGAR